MSFVSTRMGENVIGNLRHTYGQYTQTDNDIGGDIDTGLSDVKTFFATAALKQSISGGVATILTPNPEEDVVGHWEAKGY